MYGYLAHHGVKGMKWGVRNYQNADGSLTAEGRKHYGLGDLKLKRVGKDTYRTPTTISLLKSDGKGGVAVSNLKANLHMKTKVAADYYNQHRSDVLNKMSNQYSSDKKLAKTSEQKKELKQNYKAGKQYVDTYMQKTYGNKVAKAAKSERVATYAAAATLTGVSLALLGGYVGINTARVVNALKN